MTDAIVTDVTPLLTKIQELQALLNGISLNTPPEKTKKHRGNQKLPKIRHRYSATEKVARVSFSMPPSMFEQLDTYVVAKNKTRTEVIIEALVESGIVMVQRE